MNNEKIQKLAELNERKANVLLTCEIRRKEAQRAARSFGHALRDLRLLEDEIAELKDGDQSYYSEYSEVTNPSVQPMA